MKKLFTIFLFLVISFVFCISNNKISWADYKKNAINWNNKVTSEIKERVDSYLNGADIVIDTNEIVIENPEVVRQIRLEQWKRFREAGYK